MKLKNILMLIPGVQIPLMIAEHARDIMRLEDSWKGYQTAVRQDHLFRIADLEAQKKVAPPAQISVIEQGLAYHSEAYARALVQ